MSVTVAGTGAFGYPGIYATRLLLGRGREVRTLTNHPSSSHPERANAFGDRVQVFPHHFDRPEELSRSLEGASVLIKHLLGSLPARENELRDGGTKLAHPDHGG